MHERRTLSQIIRFSFVGILNTAIDFAVLNALVLAFGTGPNGILFAPWKALSFAAALANSYLLNSKWVFKGRKKPASLKAVSGPFMAVSVLGFLLNVGASSLAFNIVSAGGLLSAALASNVSALCGTLFVLAFNFVGYKFLVFKS